MPPGTLAVTGKHDPDEDRSARGILAVKGAARRTRSFHQLTLHVFEQDGGWHWGLTIERPHGVGEKVIAFSETVFHSEAEARTDGKRARELRRESFECAE